MTELEQLRQKIKAMRDNARQDLENARYFLKANSVPTYTHIQVCRYKEDVLNDVLFIVGSLLEERMRKEIEEECRGPIKKEGGGAG